MTHTNSSPNPTVKNILKTEQIIRFDADQTLSQALPHLTSSHDSAFVFDGDKFIGVVSPYFVLKSRSFKEGSKLKSCVMMPKKMHLDDSFSEVATAMLNSKIHYLPAVDDNGDFVGIVSIKRMLEYIVEHKLKHDNGTIIFSDRELISVDPEMKLSQAMALMKSEKVSRLPVTNGGGRIIGMLSQYDIADMVDDQQSAGRFDKRGEKSSMLDDVVKNHMIKMVFTIDHVPSFTEATRLMLDKGIGSLVIVDKNEIPMSIVTKRDLLNTIAQSSKV